MSRRRSLGLAGALAFSAFVSPPSPRPVTLKTSYQIHLRSTWPQLAGASKECFNGGEESLDGTLRANGDGTYGGVFTRRTRLLFCGAHGSDAAEACQLILQGEGEVSVSAVVVPDDASPSSRAARLVWVPASGHRASVSGACPTPFKGAMEAMYLTTRHSVELPLIAAGGEPMTRRLEDYAWSVEMN